jgi:hypothetical protein
MTGVAIVIPMLNEAAGLPRLLRSLAALEPPPAEVLAVDDAQKIVQRLRTITPLIVPNATHFRGPEHRKLYLEGLRLAAGEAL